MSDHLSAAAGAMQVPEALVQRSAEARAKASGASVDDILAAWAGGAAAPAATAPAPEAPSEPEAAAEDTTPPRAEPAPEPEEEPAVPAPEITEQVAVAVIEEPEPEPVEPVPLRDRVRVAGRVGTGFGLLVAVLVIVFSAQWLLPTSGVMPETEAELAFTLVPGWVVVGSALIGLAVGLSGAGLIRLVAGWKEPGMRLVSSSGPTLAVGAGAGVVVGAVVGGVVLGAGVPDPLDEALTVVPLMPAIFWTLFGWAVGGWLIGALGQVVGVPAGLDEAESADTATVRDRLAVAYRLPIFAAAGLLLVVLPAAWVFIQLPQWAPLIAIFIAGGILAFAGLSAARPGMRISMGEFLAAAAGVGVVVLIVVSVLLVQGGGHGEEEHAEDDSSEAIALIVSADPGGQTAPPAPRSVQLRPCGCRPTGT